MSGMTDRAGIPGLAGDRGAPAPCHVGELHGVRLAAPGHRAQGRSPFTGSPFCSVSRCSTATTVPATRGASGTWWEGPLAGSRVPGSGVGGSQGCSRGSARARRPPPVQLGRERSASAGEICADGTGRSLQRPRPRRPARLSARGNTLLRALIAPCRIPEVLWIVQQAYCH